MAAALGEEHLGLAAVAGRGAALDIVLGGKPADHLGDGRRLDAEGGGKVAHRHAVGGGKRLEQGLLAGMEIDAGQLTPRPHPVGVCRLGESVGDCPAVVEPHEVSDLNNEHEACMTVAGSGCKRSVKAQNARISRATRSRKAAQTASLLRFMSWSAM